MLGPSNCSFCIVLPENNPSHNSFDKTGVQVHNQHAQERHLFAGIFKDDSGVIRLASQAVWSHYHSQVVYIHLGFAYIDWLGKNLQNK